MNIKVWIFFILLWVEMLLTVGMTRALQTQTPTPPTPIPVQVVTPPGHLSDNVVISIIGVVQVTILAIIGLVQGLLLKQGKEAAVQVEQVAKRTVGVKEALVETAKKAEEVRLTLEQSTQSQSKQLLDIHTLVNSERGALLKVAATAMRALAVASSIEHSKRFNEERHLLDVRAAEEAEKLLTEHEAKQAIVDKRDGKEPKEVQA
jgi:hypothetical protein